VAEVYEKGAGLTHIPIIITQFPQITYSISTNYILNFHKLHTQFPQVIYSSSANYILNFHKLHKHLSANALKGQPAVSPGHRPGYAGRKTSALQGQKHYYPIAMLLPLQGVFHRHSVPGALPRAVCSLPLAGRQMQNYKCRTTNTVRQMQGDKYRATNAGLQIRGDKYRATNAGL
jgi:hypothetical protein